MLEALIIGGVRTAIGRIGGSLKDVPEKELGRLVVAELRRRNRVSPGDVEQVILGHVRQSSDPANTARRRRRPWNSACKRRRGLSPRGVSGCDPAVMRIAPVEATRLALRRAGLTLDRMDVIEMNGAFASQTLAVIREWVSWGID